jgi:hypothetical protein
MEKYTLRMQMLSGVITEGEYKLRLNEQTDTDFIKSEMERHIGLVTNNPYISDQEKKRRIDNIKFVVYDFFDPNTNGGKRPSNDFQFDDNWWNSIPPDINKFVIEDALIDLIRAAKGDSFGENDIPLNEKNFLNELINYKMNKEQLRMQMLSGVITESEYKVKLQENKKKKSLNESMIGGIVGIGAINQIPSRAKADYEDAFEHFLGEKYGLNEVENVEEGEEDLQQSDVKSAIDGKKLDLKKLEDATKKAMSGDSTDLTLFLAGVFEGKEIGKYEGDLPKNDLRKLEGELKSAGHDAKLSGINLDFIRVITPNKGELQVVINDEGQYVVQPRSARTITDKVEFGPTTKSSSGERKDNLDTGIKYVVDYFNKLK